MLQSKQTTKYDWTLSCLRSIATLMIVILHISQQTERILPEIHVLTDFLGVSLTFFFCITAQIYAKRTIEHPLRWFAHRYIELIVPSFLLGLVVVLPAFFTGSISRSTAIDSILSSLGFQVFVRNSWKFIQLWFLTDILICYALIPFLQKIDFKKMGSWKFLASVVLPTVILQILFSGVKLLAGRTWGGDIRLPGANAISRFYMAYALFRRYDVEENAVRKIMRVLTVLAVPVVAFTAYIRYVWVVGKAGMITSLAELLFLYTVILLGYVLYYWLYLLLKKAKLENQRMLKISDKLSLPVYLAHCHFIGYNTSFLWKYDSLAVGILVALTLTLITSIALYYLSKPIKSFLNRAF